MRRLFHPLPAGLLVTAALAGLVALDQRPGGWSLGPIASLDRLALDKRFTIRGPRPAGPDVVLVELDEKTNAEAPDLIDKRAGLARLVRAAHQAGAKVLALDIFMMSAEQPIDPALAADVLALLDRCKEGCEESEALALLRRLRPELTGDQELADALREAGSVVLALNVGARRGGAAATTGLGKGKFGQSFPGDTVVNATGEVHSSLPAFNEAARALGFVTAITDDTSTVREVLSARSVDGTLYAAFGVQAVARYLDVNRAKLVYDGVNRVLRIGDRSLPFERTGEIFLNFRGPPGRVFASYSASDVTQGRFPEGALKGRIVVVGYTYMGHDRVRTSFGDQVPGVEVNATFIDNILRGDPLRRAPYWWNVLACLAVGLLVTLLFWPKLLPGVLWQLTGAVLVLAGWLVACYLAFARSNLWLNAVWPAVTFLVASFACLAASYAKEGLHRRELRKAFSHYLADEVIKDLEKRGEPVSLGGERRVLTAMFSDIRGFTTLSERLDPLQLVKFLNTHLSAMTEAVLAQGGMLDKYIGDALMAFFGAPMPHPDHADRALGAAIAMHQALAALNAGPFKELGLTVKIGVGLNTGEMVVGNMGSERRVNYTIAGDAVNLASRLESLTKTYGVFCLVGEATRKAASPAFVFREVDLVQVKGKTEAVAIHELVAGPGGSLARHEDGESFAKGMEAWRAGRFPDARRAFEAFAARNPDDRVAPLYLERLAALGDRPPEGWNGVFVHTSK